MVFNGSSLNTELMGCVHVPDMVSENFKGALFFLDCSNDINIDTERRLYYYRAAIIFFCACCNAWMTKKIQDYLKKNKQERKNSVPEKIAKKIKCNTFEDVYQLLTNPNDSYLLGQDIPSKGMMWELIGYLYNVNINIYTNLKNKYDDLLDYRDQFMHYAERSYSNQYDIDKVKIIANSVPDLMLDIMKLIDDTEIINVYKEYIKKYKHCCEEYEVQKILNTEEKIVIFGSGNFGREALDMLGEEKVAFFVDNNEMKNGDCIGNVYIWSFNHVREVLTDYQILVAVSPQYVNEIEAQLLKEGINKQNIHRYF